METINKHNFTIMEDQKNKFLYFVPVSKIIIVQRFIQTAYFFIAKYICQILSLYVNLISGVFLGSSEKDTTWLDSVLGKTKFGVFHPDFEVNKYDAKTGILL